MTDQRRIPPGPARERARRAARMIPGFSIVDAPGQIMSEAEARANRRPTAQSRAAEQRRSQQLRASRLGADRRLRNRDGDLE